MRKNRILTLMTFCAMLGVAQNAWAVKANPRPVTIKQPDGSMINIRINGDENFHYVTTIDGYLIKRGIDGYFKYIDTKKATDLKRMSSQRVHNFNQRANEESLFVNSLTPANKLRDLLAKSKSGATCKAPQQILAKPVVNRRRVNSTEQEVESQYLVILVSYKDRPLSFSTKDFDDWLNEKGYAVDGGTGSVKDYYRDNSMGKFIPNFVVLGPYTLDYNQKYYAGNDEETGEDSNPRAMIVEACQKAKAYHPEIDFSKFDNDGDGYMDNVNVVYSGYSEASTANGDDMWPHSWTLSDESIKIDGITINNYSCSSELVGDSGTKMDGIGTFTHEFGHILGLKDMYDTDQYTNGYGLDLGDYSLYASGSYNNSSRTPPCLMAFERMQLGWCNPSELKAPEDVVLESVSTNNARYINAQPDRADGTGFEWFVLENRQKEGWDTYIPAHGLLIYHYDYTQEMVEKYWSVNGPNNNVNHLCLYVKAADGIYDSNSREGDTYPGQSGNTEFTDFSYPNSLNWNREATNVPITNIEERDGRIYFQANGGTTDMSVIHTDVPQNVRDTMVTVTATIRKATQAIREVGFCWALKTIPDINGNHKKVETSEQVACDISGLTPSSIYNVRAYMIMADETIVYGAAVPFTTECKVMEAPYIGDFSSWTNGQPDCWKIVDNNKDGTTWIYDESSEAMVYQFDYWNNADDWLISTRMKVPDKGTLFFMRGVTESTCMEKFDVYVSTKSRNIDDFHLVKHFSFADQFGSVVPEEVDLSDYIGKEIYVAFVCHSEKLQNNLWISQIYLASELDAPEITRFDLASSKEKLQVEWTPVPQATRYYLEFSEVTNTVNSEAAFVPIDAYSEISGKVEANTGVLQFTGDGMAETVTYPDGITNCMFILTSSGPQGTTMLTVEGTVDGETWKQIGETQRISSSDSEGTEVLLTDYMAGKKYLRLRFVCKYGGRIVRLKYLTFQYDAGVVWNPLAAGSVEGNGIEIEQTKPGEFQQGKTYVVQVYSGDGVLFYDASEPVYLSTATSISDISIGTSVDLRVNGNIICIKGLNVEDRIMCVTASGQVLYDNIANASEVALPVNGYKGVMILQLIRYNEKKSVKLILK